MPPPRQFPAAETWQIGQPDLIVTLPKDVIVAAKAPDQWPDILVDPGLTEDRYIQGVQIIPAKGFPVIHHIRTSIVEPTDETRHGGQLDGTDGALGVGEQGVFLNEYAIGKKGDVCLEAISPTGRVEMLSCARFRFNWHINYVYNDVAAPLLPAGTVLHSIMWHDNTAANPFNPDPDAQITYGQRTIDEMGSAWISWYYMSEEDFKRETEARRANRSTLTSSR